MMVEEERVAIDDEGKPAFSPLPAAWLEPLLELNRSILAARNALDLSRSVDKILGELLGVPRAGLLVIGEDRQFAYPVPGALGTDFGKSDHFSFAIQHRQDALGGEAIGTGFLNARSNGDGPVDIFMAALDIGKLLCVPLRSGSQLAGFLLLADKRADFTPRDLAAALTVAPFVATAVATAHGLFRLRRQQRYSEILRELAATVTSGKPIHVLMPRALRDLCHVAGGDFAMLAPLDSPPIIGRVTRSGGKDEKRLIEQACSSPDAANMLVEKTRRGSWAVIHAPILVGRHRIGTISLLGRRQHAFSDDDRNAFTRLANLVALNWAGVRDRQQRATIQRLSLRHDIADELHDEVAQLLYTAQINLDTALEGIGDDTVPAGSIRRARALLVKADASIRAVIQGLAHEQPERLEDRLRVVASAVAEEFGIEIGIESGPYAASAARKLNAALIDGLARVVREALVNAAKHAHARHVTVSITLSKHGRLCVTTSDDGVGIDPWVTSGHGLVSMRRVMRRIGGGLQVRRSPKGGTSIVASILPIDPSEFLANASRPPNLADD